MEQLYCALYKALIRIVYGVKPNSIPRRYDHTDIPKPYDHEEAAVFRAVVLRFQRFGGLGVH